MSLKNPVTPPGIDPGTVRIVAQRLNYYAIPGPQLYLTKVKTGTLVTNVGLQVKSLFLLDLTKTEGTDIF